ISLYPPFCGPPPAPPTHPITQWTRSSRDCSLVPLPFLSAGPVMNLSSTLAAAALLLLLPVPAPAQQDLGDVRFANSGAPAAQAPFLRGLALLHNFEYGTAAAAFREAQAADPGFVMAYWGEAMTYNHPVRMEQGATPAPAVPPPLPP